MTQSIDALDAGTGHEPWVPPTSPEGEASAAEDERSEPSPHQPCHLLRRRLIMAGQFVLVCQAPGFLAMFPANWFFTGRWAYWWWAYSPDTRSELVKLATVLPAAVLVGLIGGIWGGHYFQRAQNWLEARLLPDHCQADSRGESPK